MKFRKIKSDDYTNCAKNLVSAYKGAPWYNKWTEEEALLRIENNNKIIAMCIGRIDYYFSNMNQFCIDEFHVIPEFQQKGVGKNLMNSVSNSLKVDGINKIFLITGGELAEYFYEKTGFMKSNEGSMMELDL